MLAGFHASLPDWRPYGIRKGLVRPLPRKHWPDRPKTLGSRDATESVSVAVSVAAIENLELSVAGES